MSYIAEAHADWHSVNGRYNSLCPLDCGAGEPIDEWYCQVEGCQGSSATFPTDKGPETSTSPCTATPEAHAAYEVQAAAEDAAWYAENPWATPTPAATGYEPF